MKIRFVVTLMAVAIAVAGAKAFALAPVIGFIPSPIIADDVPATNDNIFVYPDALYLNTLAVDPDESVTSATTIWSYYESTARYRVNNRNSLNLVTDDPNLPGVKEVGGTLDTDDPSTAGRDNDVRTITFRDATLSPVGGPNTDPTPGDPTSSVVANRVMTLFASDGAAYTSNSFVVYTESNGVDRLSGTPLILDLDQVPSTALGWTWGLGAGTLTESSSNGLCIQAPLAGSNAGTWVSPYGIVDLVKNAVYRFRMTMDSGGSPIAAGSTPFWDLVIDNFDPGFTQNKYFGDYMVWDAEGGANAIGLANGRQLFDVYWAPTALKATDWNDPVNGEFKAAFDAANDIRLIFRMLDTNSGNAIDGQNDVGTICLKNLTVEHVPIDKLVVSRTLYSETDMNSSNFAIGSLFGFGTGNNTLATFSGGDLTLVPNSAVANAWQAEVINIDPGDSTLNVGVPSTIPDNYPVVWESDKLLMSTINVEAPDATGENNPPDGYSMGFDVVTNELLSQSTLLSGPNTLGFPKFGSTTDLVMFFYTHNKTRTSIVNGDRLRPRLILLLNAGLGSNGLLVNNGGVKINSYQVDELLAP